MNDIKTAPWFERYQPIARATRLLASQCDGAREEDNRGFNKNDSYLGHALADTPLESWSFDDFRQMYTRLRKYRGQLSRLGIDYDTLPSPFPRSLRGLTEQIMGGYDG